MKTTIVKIGNSRGIRIPKPILQQCGLDAEVELEVHNGQLIVRRAGKTREKWAAEFKKMAEQGDDQLLYADSGTASSWDEKEWEW
jgi:antitoxin MazE